jgi:hypothetical protein
LIKERKKKMSKKKLTKKKKKQLLALFMTTAITANTMMVPMGVFAEELSDANSLVTESDTAVREVIPEVATIDPIYDGDTVVTGTMKNYSTYGSSNTTLTLTDKNGNVLMYGSFSVNNGRFKLENGVLGTNYTAKEGDIVTVGIIGLVPHPEEFLKSKTTVVLPKKDQTSITANDFSLNYGESATDANLITKAGAKATDKGGSAESVSVKSSNVDTSKPGLYDVTFVSASGLTKTVKATVKEPDASAATIEAKDFSLGYKETVTNADLISKAGAKAYDKYGKEEAVTVKESKVDTSKPGAYDVTFESASGKTKTVKATVQEPKSYIEAHDFELDYKAEFNEKVAIEKAGAKAYDEAGKEESVSMYLSNVDTSKPGYYHVVFKSASNKTVEVGVTVNEPNGDLVSLTVGKETAEVDYGSDWNDAIARELFDVHATNEQGEDETDNVIVTTQGGFSTSKPGKYNIMFTSPSNEELRVLKSVTVLPSKIIGSEPIIEASDKTYQVGETLNPLLGVTAHDPEDGDLTDKVKADSSNVNMSKAGDYDLVLSVTDSDGNTTTETVKIHVVDKLESTPVIKGADDIVIDERSKFEPLKGVTAQDGNGKDITANLTYTGTVDTSTPDVYTVKYYVFDEEGNVASVTRQVTVQSEDSKPIIMSPDKLTIKQNSKFDPTLYVQAYDKEDGDITDQVVILGQVYTDKLGPQFITYKVTDSDGNGAQKMMEVEVVAVLGNAPVITGADDVEIEINSNFDPISGVTAYDEEDGDLTSEIKYNGIINTGAAGEYEIVYTVWDSDYNTETVVRKVTVVDPTVAPVIEANDFSLEFEEVYNDNIAIEKAGAKAFDKYGEEEAVTVKSSNVDTSKPGTYTVTFESASGQTKSVVVTVNEPQVVEGAPIKVEYVNGEGEELAPSDTLTGNVGDAYTTQAKEIDGYTAQIPDNATGVFTDAEQKVTYVYEKIKDLSLEANDFKIGQDTYVTGTAGEDIAFVDLYVNGTFSKRAQVLDGTFKVYGTGIQESKDNVYVMGLDSNKKPFNPTITADVALSSMEEIESKLKANPYHLGEAYVTGTYDNDQADRVKLLVDGQVVKQMIFDNNNSDQFQLSTSGFITAKDQIVEIAEYNGNRLVNKVDVKIVHEEDYRIEVEPYYYGDPRGIATGTWSGEEDATHVALLIDNQIVKIGELNENGTYSLYIGTWITSLSAEGEIVLYNKMTKKIFARTDLIIKRNL